MKYRHSVKIILINPDQKILLICAEDPNTYSVDNRWPRGRFWFPIGGQIEAGESLEETAMREIYEESGIAAEHIQLGPHIWYGEYDLILSGQLTRMVQKYFVATTNKRSITLEHLTPEEKVVIKDLQWFSLEEIKASSEKIYPTLLPDYLPQLLEGQYPTQPFEIDLAR